MTNLDRGNTLYYPEHISNIEGKVTHFVYNNIIGIRLMTFRPAKIIYILALFAMLTPCQAKENKVMIVAGVPPYAWLAQQIAGDAGETASIVSSGVDPHTFEPTKKHVHDIYSANMIIISGLPFEERLIEKLPKERRKLVLNLKGDHTGHVHHDDSCELQHSWLSPALLLEHAELIKEHLAMKYPEKKDTFTTNAAAVAAEIRKTQTAVSSRLDKVLRRKVYIFHPALEAFSSEFNIEQVSIEHEGKSPGPRRLGNIIAEARNEGINFILTHPQFDRKGAEAISLATGAELIEFDPLEYNPLTNINRLSEIILEKN